MKRDATPEEKNAYNRAYYAANRDYVRARGNSNRKSKLDHYKAWAREYSKKKRSLDPESRRKFEAEYREKNREKIRAYAKAYREANLEKSKAWAKKYIEANREKIRASQNAALAKTRKIRWANDPQFRIGSNARRRIHAAIKAAGVKKNFRTVDVLGCSISEFHAHLESQFSEQNGFSWENYGTIWEIDHIVPVIKFDLTDPQQLRKAFHYTNCQPLRAVENAMKGDKLPHELNHRFMPRVRVIEQPRICAPINVRFTHSLVNESRL